MSQTGQAEGRAPEQLAREWLALVDGGRGAESWAQAAPGFQRAVSESQWASASAAAREPLGALVSRTLRSADRLTELPGAPDGDYTVFQFDTTFANKRAAVETVTFVRSPDGRWQPTGYFIR